MKYLHNNNPRPQKAKNNQPTKPCKSRTLTDYKNNIVVEEIDLVLNQKVEKIKLNEILENIYNEW